MGIWNESEINWGINSNRSYECDKNNISMKEFRACDPVTKIIVADVVSNVTSSAAAKFLKKIKKELPFDIKWVQVDGGTEFMKHS